MIDQLETHSPTQTAAQHTLTAIRLSAASMEIRPAGRDREWMQSEAGRFARRCLPLMIANQAGWELLNPVAFSAWWDGGDGLESVRILPQAAAGAMPPVTSHFGSGIVTWTLPYLFRTTTGWNLLARGPANRPKDGISALEGVIETDWACSPFTMNWKFTRPGHLITFEQGEPFAMLVPTRRGELESFDVEVQLPAQDPDSAAKFARWMYSRVSFLHQLTTPDSHARQEGWQRHYMLGVDVDGTKAPTHQTKLRLKSFSGLGGQ